MAKEIFKPGFLNNKKFICEIEKSNKSKGFDYILNQYEEFNKVNIVESVDDIDYSLEGWYIYIIKNIEEDDRWLFEDPDNNCMFLQVVNNQHGRDHHVLTNEEIDNLMLCYLKYIGIDNDEIL